MRVKNEKNLEIIWHFYDIKTVEDLLVFSEDRHLCEILHISHGENLKSLLSISSITPEDLTAISQNRHIIFSLQWIHEDKLAKILNFYDIKTLEQFINLCEMRSTMYVVRDAKR
jgi:hypothetical protein